MAEATAAATARRDDYRPSPARASARCMVQLASGADGDARRSPRAARTCAAALPAVYQEDDFGMRFVGALEALLDPIVAVLDALPAHFDPDHAPRDVLDLLARWLGVELDESQTLQHAARAGPPGGRARPPARHAARAGARARARLPEPAAARRGPGRRVRSRITATREWRRPPSFVVYCDKPIPEEQAAVARCIEHVKPVHTTYRLRVKAPKKAKAA